MNFLSANSSWVWVNPREKPSLSILITNMPELLSLLQTKKTSMVELSGLNGADKLLEDTNHKPVPMVFQVKPTPFSSETLDSELNNGPSKNSSNHVELFKELESLWVKTADQEVSLTLNSITMLLLLKP